jgi:hypothetical protein
VQHSAHGPRLRCERSSAWAVHKRRWGASGAWRAVRGRSTTTRDGETSSQQNDDGEDERRRRGQMEQMEQNARSRASVSDESGRGLHSPAMPAPSASMWTGRVSSQHCSARARSPRLIACRGLFRGHERSLAERRPLLAEAPERWALQLWKG